ncbi:flavodoxin FldB [Vibrio profundum]|uniref:flavodoxin FldB n=1 Tax=Vibrio profundum TaxID=2910247 RepID=UPI003D0DB81A
MKIGLFYGSTTCYTEMTAEKIRAILGEELVDLHNVKDSSLTLMQDYDLLIVGISTWDFGEIQEDWNEIWSDIATVDLTGKQIALFGLGDQEGYGEWYLDAMGLLHDQLKQVGAQFVGYWPNQGYTFDASKALIEGGNRFVGLALDEDSQYEQSEERIATWCEQVLTEYHATL